MSKKPSKYLFDFVKSCAENTYILTQEKIESRNVIHIDKSSFFKDYDSNNKPYQARLEVSKNLIMLMETELSEKYSFFLCLEDDVFVRSQENLQSLHKDLISNTSDIVTSHGFFEPPELWFEHWENNIKNESEINQIEKYYAAVSPVTRYSKDILFEAYEIYNRYQKIYFHETIYPSICKKNNMRDSILDKKKHKMLLTLPGWEDSIEELSDAIKSNYNFIHPVKHGGIL